MESDAARLLLVGAGATPHGDLARLLERQGREVVSAENGPQALALLREQTVDLVLVGLEQSGEPTSRLLQDMKASEALRAIPVIILSGMAQMDLVEQCLALGADDYLLTPLSPTMLKVQVNDYLKIGRKRQLERDQTKHEELLKIERDVQIARQIQLSFLPKELPQPEGWEIAALFEPAREVAGDFYDAFMLSQNRRLGFVMADVVDKGVPAALFMALVRSMIRAFAQQNYAINWANLLEEVPATRPTPGSARRRSIPTTGTIALKNAVTLTNNYIGENHGDDNMFATLFFGMVDPTNGQLAYINGGHNPPFIIGQDGALKATLKPTGPAVGMFPGAEFVIEQAEFEPGDILYAYTDGVTEARNADGAFFTEARLLSILKAPASSAQALLDRVQKDLSGFMGGAARFDDITMIAVGRKA